jgi:hypothetical protein
MVRTKVDPERMLPSGHPDNTHIVAKSPRTASLGGVQVAWLTPDHVRT